MITPVERYKSYVKAYRDAPGDYPAQEKYLVEVIEELLAEISKRDSEIEHLSEYKWMYQGLL